MKGTFYTRSGIGIDPVNLSADEVEPTDIAHHLALINRFSGATPKPYSVAQHSVKMAQFAEDCGWGPLVQLGCLMHDAQEAYLGDVTSPVKSKVYHRADTGAWDDYEHWKSVERRVLGVICLALGIFPKQTVDLPTVRIIDRIMLVHEMRALGFPEGAAPVVEVPAWAEGHEVRIRPWPWDMAERAFNASLYRLQLAVRGKYAEPEQVEPDTTLATLDASRLEVFKMKGETK